MGQARGGSGVAGPENKRKIERRPEEPANDDGSWAPTPGFLSFVALGGKSLWELNDSEL